MNIRSQYQLDEHYKIVRNRVFISNYTIINGFDEFVWFLWCTLRVFFSESRHIAYYYYVLITCNSILTSPLARGPVVELAAGVVVVDEQAVLEDQLLVGRVREGGESGADHRDRGEHAEHELRPTLRVAHVYGADQYPGDGGDEARDTGSGQRGVLGLDPRSHS